ncbi:MAG: site-specific integrase [Candidatus Omnitrophica bacterium]|nr:site-specific integrase [Candidatus Omnitrophota bacterium]
MKGVFQNKKTGNWYIDYRLPNGRRRRETIGTSKKLAENVLSKRKVGIAEGKFLDVVKKERIKFEDFAQEYLNIHSKQHKKSWVTDSYHIADLKRFLGGKFLYTITAKDIEDFKIARLKEGVATSTVNRQMGTLRGMFNKAIAWGKLQVNPMRSVQFLKEAQGRLRFLEQEEIIKLLAHCNKKLRPIVVVALFTGMRRGEIFSLKWHDIDFKRNNITLLDTKNGDKRELPMNEQVKTALIRVRKNPESPFVFCNEAGEPLHDIRKSFSTVLAKSGITSFHFHDLRHTFASQLVMSGVDINTVRELLGHKDITMTLRYSHLAPSHKQRAVDILGKKVDTFWTLSPKAETSEKSEVLQSFDKQLVK